MDGLWTGGRLPRVERWFERVKERSTFKPALLDWMPPELSSEMKENGRKSWPAVRKLLAL
jgi:glutathione S-transferase